MVCVLFREPEPAENHLKDMLQQLVGLIAAKPSEKAVVCQGDCTLTPFIVMTCAFQHQLQFLFLPEEAEDPACIPIFWISKWVDYSDKYGLGESLRTWTPWVPQIW